MTERQCETVYTKECRPVTQRLYEQVHNFKAYRNIVPVVREFGLLCRFSQGLW